MSLAGSTGCPYLGKKEPELNLIEMKLQQSYSHTDGFLVNLIIEHLVITKLLLYISFDMKTYSEWKESPLFHKDLDDSPSLENWATTSGFIQQLLLGYLSHVFLIIYPVNRKL